MQELIKTNIKREPGKLYFCKTDIDGYIILCSAELNRGGKRKIKSKTEFTPLAEEQKKKSAVSKLKFWRKE